MEVKATRTVDYLEWARNLAGEIEETKLDIKRLCNRAAFSAAYELNRKPLDLLSRISTWNIYDQIMEESNTLDTLLATQDRTRRNPFGFAYFINREGEYFYAPVNTGKESEPAVKGVFDLCQYN